MRIVAFIAISALRPFPFVFIEGNVKRSIFTNGRNRSVKTLEGVSTIFSTLVAVNRRIERGCERFDLAAKKSEGIKHQAPDSRLIAKCTRRKGDAKGNVEFSTVWFLSTGSREPRRRP